MIKGFLLAFNVILFALFLIGMIFGLKTKETGMGCNGCKNLVKSMEDTAFGRKELRFCMLDNKCKDREIENE